MASSSSSTATPQERVQQVKAVLEDLLAERNTNQLPQAVKHAQAAARESGGLLLPRPRRGECGVRRAHSFPCPQPPQQLLSDMRCCLCVLQVPVCSMQAGTTGLQGLASRARSCQLTAALSRPRQSHVSR
jgi:hypothetical protein